MSLCVVTGCDRQARSRRICKLHYDRFRKSGELASFQPLTHVDRFWAHVDMTLGCWNWTGGKNEDGYGVCNLTMHGQREVKAHRLSYLLHHGALDRGLLVQHSCNNPSCVNPAHLSLGTDKSNAAYREECGRGKGGRRLGDRQRLTVDDVVGIRNGHAQGMSNRELARLYFVTKGAISHIVNRRIWKRVA